MNSSKKSRKIMIIHGPNLNMLGKREPEVYGKETLDEINKRLKKLSKKLKIDIEIFQSNHEGELIEKIQEASGDYSGLVINPAAFTHTSVGIRDALLLLDIPVIEIHISNIYKREAFRHKSMIADVVTAQISGFGIQGYIMALEAITKMGSSPD